MNHRTQQDDTQRIAERAAQWLCALEAAGPAEQAVFADWVAESPLHLKEFLLVSALEAQAGMVGWGTQWDVEEILARRTGNVIGLREGSSQLSPPSLPPLQEKRERKTRQWSWGLAAAAILVLAAGLFVDGMQRPRYATAVGEERSLELADGSILRLGSGSRVRLHYSRTLREVRLLQGEAMFRVAQQAAWPFVVKSGTARIQALGTQFNVNRRPSGTTVMVIEGSVRVSPETRIPAGRQSAAQVLTAGQEVRVGENGHIERRAPADIANAADWRQRRLVFRDDTLEDIVAEFNRYNRNPQLRLADPALRARRYTAVFDADDPKSLIEFLREDEGLALAAHGDELAIETQR